MTKGNAATLSRIPLSLALVLFIFWQAPYAPWLAAFTVVLAAAADTLDGYWARQSNNISTFGIYLDAVVDKVFVLSGLISLMARGLIPVWIVLTIMSRDILIDGLRSFAAAEKVIIPANQLGKHKTTSSWIALIAVILQVPGNYWLMVLTTTLSVVSGAVYLYQSRTLWLRGMAGKPIQGD